MKAPVADRSQPVTEQSTDNWLNCQLVQGKQGSEACYSGEVPITVLLKAIVRKPFDAKVGICEEQTGINRNIIPGRPEKIADDYEEILASGEVPELGCALLVDETNNSVVHRGGGRYSIKPLSLTIFDAQHRTAAFEHALANPDDYQLLLDFIRESTMTVKVIRAVNAETARRKFIGVNTQQRRPSRVMIVDMMSCQPDERLSPHQLNEKIVVLALQRLANDPNSCWHGRIDLTGEYNQTVPPTKKITNAGELLRCSLPLVRVLRDRLNLNGTDELIEAVRSCLHNFWEYVRLVNEEPFKEYHDYSLQKGCARGVCLVVPALVSYYASGGRREEFKGMSLQQFWDDVFPVMLEKPGNLLKEADFWHRTTGNARHLATQKRGTDAELAKKVWGYMKPDYFRNKAWDELLPRQGSW